MTLSERSQTQKTTCCLSPLMRNVQQRQIQRDRQQTGGSKLEGGQNGKGLLNGYRFPCGVIKTFQNYS